MKTHRSPIDEEAGRDLSDRHRLCQVTVRVLHFALPALAFMYALVSIFHLVRFEAPQAWYLFAVAIVSVSLLVAGHGVTGRLANPSKWAERMTGGALLLLLINTLSVIYLSGNLNYSVNVLLLLMGAGFLLFSLPRLIVFHLMTLGGWLLVILGSPSPQALDHLGVPTGIALFISYVVRKSMVGNVLELEKTRRLDVARRYDLESALNVTKTTTPMRTTERDR